MHLWQSKRKTQRAREGKKESGREREEGETEIKLTSEACNVVLLVLH